MLTIIKNTCLTSQHCYFTLYLPKTLTYQTFWYNLWYKIYSSHSRKISMISFKAFYNNKKYCETWFADVLITEVLVCVKTFMLPTEMFVFPCILIKKIPIWPLTITTTAAMRSNGIADKKKKKMVKMARLYF